MTKSKYMFKKAAELAKYIENTIDLRMQYIEWNLSYNKLT
jgi:hypothetical protein